MRELTDGIIHILNGSSFRMKKVKLSFAGDWGLLRQTPEGSGVWGNYEFHINGEEEKYDYWIVFNNLEKTETTVCKNEKTLLITGEPASVHRYDAKFLSQFGAVITCQQNLKHTNRYIDQQGLPWHILRECSKKDPSFSYDTLLSGNDPEKQKLISVISSNKIFTRGHKKRVRFLEHLKNAFGDEIDIFGRGIRDIEKKWDALAPYKYHIVLENAAFDDYWTEKLSDSYLAMCYPIYFGCPNISKYFEENMLTKINIDNPSEAVQIIKRCIEEKRFEARKENIRKAKELVLNRYNLFALISDFLDNNVRESETFPFVETILRPEKNHGKLKKLFRKAVDFVGKT